MDRHAGSMSAASFRRTRNNNNKNTQERKPPPTPKFQPKVIRDSRPDFQINPQSDVCRICYKMLWMHYLVGVSRFRQVCYTSSVDSTRNTQKKCPKIPQSAMVRKMK